MIYLIGGVLKSGKTLIGSKLSIDKKIPVFSTDFLLYGLGGDDGMFSYYDSDIIVSEKLEPILLKIISFLVKNDEDYIIEGTHITTSLFEKLKEKYNDNIKAIFLGYSNKSKIEKYNEIIKNEKNIKNKWYNNISVDDFISLIDDKIIESKELKIECEKNKFNYLDVENIDEITSVINKLFFGM